MPDDFYDFFEFCKSIDHKDPKSNFIYKKITFANIYLNTWFINLVNFLIFA